MREVTKPFSSRRSSVVYNLAAAQGDAERAVKIRTALYGGSHQHTATAKAPLAQVFIKREQYNRAEPILREVVKVLTQRRSRET